MSEGDKALKLTIIGGGMITREQLLPSIYHLQRLGMISDIGISALNFLPLRALAEDETLREAFPGQAFTAYPDLSQDPGKKFPEMFKGVIKKNGAL